MTRGPGEDVFRVIREKLFLFSNSATLPVTINALSLYLASVAVRSAAYSLASSSAFRVGGGAPRTSTTSHWNTCKLSVRLFIVPQTVAGCPGSACFQGSGSVVQNVMSWAGLPDFISR